MSATSPSTSPKLSSLPPSTSPPRTPVENKHRTSLGSPPSDDSSIIDDLSFEYVFDNEGNYVRLSKGLSTKSNHSSPPTPQDNLPLQPTDSYTKPSPPAITRRASLSRSESAYPVLVTITAPKSDAQPPRSFQRATSGPALMNNKVRPLPRRVAMEESNKQRPLTRTPRTADILQHEKENLNVSDSEQGHEPHPSRAIPPRVTYSRSVHLDGHQRQIMSGPHRAGRVMVSSSMSASAVRLPEYNISESHSIPVATPELENEAEDESVHSQAPSTTPFPSSGPLSEVGNVGDTEIIESSPLSIPASTRQRSYGLISTSSARDSGLPPDVVLALSTTSTQPRRSPSLNDALNLHDSGYGQHQRQQQQLRDEYQNSRSGVAANDNNDNAGGPRRVTLEERERDIRKYRFEEIERRQVEQDHYYESHYEQGQQKIQQQSLPTIHRQHSHKRRDSDTLRSMPMSVALGSPTVVEPPHTGEVSPRMSPPGAKVGRLTPPGKISPSGLKGRISPALIKTGRVSPPQPRATGRVSPASSTALSTHRRSPTASETFMKDGLHERAAKRWSVTEREDEHAHRHEREREREREGRRIQQQQQESQQQIRAAPAPPVPAAAATSSSQTSRSLVVNKKTYARLDMIGKGGSSRVYRVFDSANTIYAIKRVALDKTDSETMSGYMNEIALLKRLAGNSRIIRLIDSEVRPGPGGSKGYLMLVMECGEVDLAKLISEAVHEPLDMVRVAGYWKQMLQAVHVIHEEKIVHSDLKPANFVIVKGQLKLIDFGIANAIANDTTNIQRDHQIGTVNFMSPEAIELPDGMRRLKVGRPSDIWSLGCILYQMIYGMPPFQHLNVYQKMKAIPDAAHVIDFPEYSVPLAPNPRTSSGASSGTSTPPKRLDHLKTKVRGVVIDTMKSCLLRNPKERATIPELLNQNWLAMTDSELAADETIVKLAPGENILKVQSSSNIAKSASGETFVKVGADETVINPYYMRQLLEYGIKLGQAQNTDMSPERLLREAERLVLELKSLQPS